MRNSAIKNNPELDGPGRILASLALEGLRQDRALVVRQREQLRRALAKAGAVLDWSGIPGEGGDRAAAVKRDVAALAEAGSEILENDLIRQLERKKAEIDTLDQVTRTLWALAADSDTVYPAEVVYAHTGRDGQRRLVTKTETLTLQNVTEATSAASALEKKIEGYSKLRDEMLEDLHGQHRQILLMREGLGGFVAASSGLVLEVLATLT